eukprot:677364-Amphidinium_carterae.1
MVQSMQGLRLSALLEAKGTSSMSLRAWNSFAQHLVTSGLASVVPSAGLEHECASIVVFICVYGKEVDREKAFPQLTMRTKQDNL